MLQALQSLFTVLFYHPAYSGLVPLIIVLCTLPVFFIVAALFRQNLSSRIFLRIIAWVAYVFALVFVASPSMLYEMILTRYPDLGRSLGFAILLAYMTLVALPLYFFLQAKPRSWKVNLSGLFLAYAVTLLLLWHPDHIVSEGKPKPIPYISNIIQYGEKIWTFQSGQGLYVYKNGKFEKEIPFTPLIDAPFLFKEGEQLILGGRLRETGFAKNNVSLSFYSISPNQLTLIPKNSNLSLKYLGGAIAQDYESELNQMAFEVGGQTFLVSVQDDNKRLINAGSKRSYYKFSQIVDAGKVIFGLEKSVPQESVDSLHMDHEKSRIYYLNNAFEWIPVPGSDAFNIEEIFADENGNLYFITDSYQLYSISEKISPKLIAQLDSNRSNHFVYKGYIYSTAYEGLGRQPLNQGPWEVVNKESAEKRYIIGEKLYLYSASQPPQTQIYDGNKWEKQAGEIQASLEKKPCFINKGEKLQLGCFDSAHSKINTPFTTRHYFKEGSSLYYANEEACSLHFRDTAESDYEEYLSKRVMGPISEDIYNLSVCAVFRQDSGLYYIGRGAAVYKIQNKELIPILPESVKAKSVVVEGKPHFFTTDGNIYVFSQNEILEHDPQGWKNIFDSTQHSELEKTYIKDVIREKAGSFLIAFSDGSLQRLDSNGKLENFSQLPLFNYTYVSLNEIPPLIFASFRSSHVGLGIFVLQNGEWKEVLKP